MLIIGEFLEEGRWTMTDSMTDLVWWAQANNVYSLTLKECRTQENVERLMFNDNGTRIPRKARIFTDY